MRKPVVLAATGIAVLGIASLAIVIAATRGMTDVRAGRLEPSSLGVPRDPPAPPGAAMPAGAVDGSAFAASSPPTAAPDPQTDAWESVVPVDSAEEMGQVGPAFASALSDSFGALGRCFETSRAVNGEVGAVAHDGGGSEKRGPSVLLLEFETTAGGARIVGAPVGRRGSAGDDVILCAQKVFRDLRIDAPGVVPGRRYRMRYALVQ